MKSLVKTEFGIFGAGMVRRIITAAQHGFCQIHDEFRNRFDFLTLGKAEVFFFFGWRNGEFRLRLFFAGDLCLGGSLCQPLNTQIGVARVAQHGIGWLITIVRVCRLWFWIDLFPGLVGRIVSRSLGHRFRR